MSTRISCFFLTVFLYFAVFAQSQCVRKAENVQTWGQEGRTFYLEPAFDLDFKVSTLSLGTTPVGGVGYSYLEKGCVSGPYLNGTVELGHYHSVARPDGYAKVEGHIVVRGDGGSNVGLDFYGLQSASPSPTAYFILGVKIRTDNDSVYTEMNRLMFVGRVLDTRVGDAVWILRVFAIQHQPVGFVAPQIPFYFNLHSSGNGSVAHFWMIDDLLDQKPLYGSTVNGDFDDGNIMLPGVAGDFITYRTDNWYEPDTLYISATNFTGTPEPLVVYETTGIVGPSNTRAYYYQVSALYANPTGPNGWVVKKRFLSSGRLGEHQVNGQPRQWLWFDHFSIEVV